MIFAIKEEPVVQHNNNSSDYQTIVDNNTQQIEQAKTNHTNASDEAANAMNNFDEVQGYHNELINQTWEEDGRADSAA